MKLYELTYLITQKISEEELKALGEEISSLIQKEGGVLNEINSPIKKSLFFPIKKEKEVILADLTFYLEPERLANLEKELKSEKKILRYLILTKKITKKVKPTKGRPVISKPKIKEKVELKDIEKKLEEILGE